MKQIFGVALLLGILGTAYVLYRQAVVSPIFLGLPTVPCIDTTKSLGESYTLRVSITIDGKPYPLDGAIGHDYGNCLRSIYTNDKTGTVYVKANNKNVFTLGDFFSVWKKVFSASQLMQYQVGNGHELVVTVDGQTVSTFERTELSPDASINISYR